MASDLVLSSCQSVREVAVGGARSGDILASYDVSRDFQGFAEWG